MATPRWLFILARHRRTGRERDFCHPGPTRRQAIDYLVQTFPDWTFYP